jgi:hypothetical protein
MRLHVGKLRAEELLRAVNGKLLDDIHILATAVVTLPRIAFGLFIGEHATRCLHYRRARVVFAGDHLEAVFLALDLVGNCPPNLRVVLLNEIGHVVVFLVNWAGALKAEKGVENRRLWVELCVDAVGAQNSPSGF